jgi:hypothetical protein
MKIMNPPDFTQLNLLHEKLKEQLIAFITNKDIDLDERFEVWQQAPVTMKEHKTFTEDFAGLPEDYIAYDSYVSVDRYQTVTVERILGAALGQYREGGILSPEDLILFKEDVLAKNINSFVYDW